MRIRGDEEKKREGMCVAAAKKKEGRYKKLGNFIHVFFNFIILEIKLDIQPF